MKLKFWVTKRLMERAVAQAKRGSQREGAQDDGKVKSREKDGKLGGLAHLLRRCSSFPIMSGIWFVLAITFRRMLPNAGAGLKL